MTNRASVSRNNIGRIGVLTAAIAIFTLACGGPEFHVNPALGPTPAVSPQPTSTAQVLRTVPFDETPSAGGGSFGSRVPFILNQTPLPQTSFLVTPTSVVLPDGRVIPPGVRLLGSGSIRLDSPEWRFRKAFDDIEWQKAASVESQFYWMDPSDSAADNEQPAEILMQVAGEYQLEVVNDGTSGAWTFLQNNRSQFHLNVSQVEPASSDPIEGELVAHRTRLTTDTVGTGLKTYRSLAEWRDDAEREIAGIGMFISLALTGGRIVEQDLSLWLTFQPGEVVETTETGPDGERVTVFEANRVNESGDREAWKVWLDVEGRPERIELTITSEDPARSLRDAELEITYSGEVLDPAGVTLRDS